MEEKDKNKDKDKEAGQGKELEEKSALCKEYLDHLVRLKAEFENYKKRAEKERMDYVKFANAELIKDLIPVMESLKMGLAAAKTSGSSQELMKGLEMVSAELQDTLEKNGLMIIEAKDRPYDHHVHEVVEYVETDEMPENTVVDEVKSGYLLYGKLLRPALVKISKKKAEK